LTPLLDARELINALEVNNPGAVKLAVAVSLASRLEPELLRAARLEMLPSLDASAEADLWLSPLMSSRSALFAVLRPGVADALRERLCSDPPRLEMAWRVLSRIHANAPAALRAEEEITWRVLSNPEDAQVGRLFDSVFSAMQGGRSGLAKWAARALPRMPVLARQSGAAWRVAEKAAEMLGGQPILAAELTQAPISGFSESVPIESLPTIPLGLRLFENALRISQPPEAHSEKIDIPKTTPLVLELEWVRGSESERRTASFGAGSTQLVRPIDSSNLRITTAARDVYTPRLLEEVWRQEGFTEVKTSNGLTARAYRGNGAVMLAFDLESNLSKGLMGFAIQRRGPDGVATWLNNWNSPSPTSSPKSSIESPIQKFRWLDLLGRDSSGQYEYTVQTVYEQGRGNQGVSVSIDVTPPLGAIEVGFTNTLIAEAEAEPLKPARAPLRYDTAPFAARYRELGGSAYRLISEFIAACVEDPRYLLDVFAFDFDHPDILASFITLGQRLRIILDDSPAHKNRQYDLEALLKRAGCQVYHAHFKRMSHNKVMVRKISGQPTEVLTGSANFSINSLFAQQNYVMVICDQGVASAYAGYFEEVLASATTEVHHWITFEQPRLPRIRLLTCPSNDLVPEILKAVGRAKRSIIYSLGDPPDETILRAIDSRLTSGQVFLAGIIHSNGGQRVRWGPTLLASRPAPARRQLTSTTTGATAGNGKFIVVDFDLPDSVLYAGSSTFSQESSASNGDNVLEIRDPSIATQFAIEALRMMDHYRFRMRAQSAGAS
jgi:hypothetical protein